MPAARQEACPSPRAGMPVLSDPLSDHLRRRAPANRHPMDRPYDTAPMARRTAIPAAVRPMDRPWAAAVSSLALVWPAVAGRRWGPRRVAAGIWYRVLRKPGFQPPDGAIPVAWTLIDSALAVGAYRLLRLPSGAPRNRALAWLGLNVGLIGGWSALVLRPSQPAGQHRAGGGHGGHRRGLRRRRVAGRPGGRCGRRAFRRLGGLCHRADRRPVAAQPVIAMSQTYGIEAPHGRHAHDRSPAAEAHAVRYLVLLPSATMGSRLARLFGPAREPVAEFDAGAPEIQLMIQGLAPAHTAMQVEWDAALSGHSEAERIVAEVYTLDV